MASPSMRTRFVAPSPTNGHFTSGETFLLTIAAVVRMARISQLPPTRCGNTAGWNRIDEEWLP